MFLLPIIIGAMAFGGVAVAAKKKPAGAPAVDDGDVARSDDELPDAVAPVTKVDVRALMSRVGAPAIWQDFFAMTAFGESRSNPMVGLGIPTGAPQWADMHASKAEARAAAKSYASNKSWLAGCWPAAAYAFGSGGLFAMLPAAALAAFRNDSTLRCLHPWTIFDERVSSVQAAWFARRLQGWSNWTGTVLSLRAGWGNPAAMGKAPAAKKRAKWAGHCQSVGLSPAFLDTKLPAWKPAPARDLFVAVGADWQWLPPGMNAGAAA